MEQLGGLDAAFLALETRTTSGHVGGVIILDPTTAPEPLTFERFIRLLRDRIALVPLLRRRLVTVPLGIDQPYWIEDPDFDLEFHLREMALPAPGNNDQLKELIGRLHSRPLDLRRPLWEIYLISGLESGRVALYTKVHHAAIDGASGAELLTAILDLDPAGRPPVTDNWSPERPPSDVELLGRAALDLGARPWQTIQFAGNLLGAAPALGGVVKPYASRLIEKMIGNQQRDGGQLVGASLNPPRTPLNHKLSAHRRWTFRTISLDGVKAIKNAHGVTVNDVIMAMSAGAVRTWLLDREALPEAPLVAMVPVSVRQAGDQAGGNKVSSMFAVLPTNRSDPIERLKVAHEATKIAKQQHMALPDGLVEDVGQFMVPGLLGRATRVSMALGVLGRLIPSNIVISNVPGPNIPIYLGGALMTGYYPVSTLADGQGLNITVLGYHGGLHFGLVADRELVPDVEDIMNHLVTEYEVLLATVPKTPAAKPRATRKAVVQKKAAAAKKPAEQKRTTQKSTAKKAVAKKTAGRKAANR